jgi:hypothetical protein
MTTATTGFIAGPGHSGDRQGNALLADQLLELARGHFGLTHWLIGIKAKREHRGDDRDQNRLLAAAQIGKWLMRRFDGAEQETLCEHEHVQRAQHDTEHGTDADD